MNTKPGRGKTRGKENGIHGRKVRSKRSSSSIPRSPNKSSPTSLQARLLSSARARTTLGNFVCRKRFLLQSVQTRLHFARGPQLLSRNERERTLTEGSLRTVPCVPRALFLVFRPPLPLSLVSFLLPTASALVSRRRRKQEVEERKNSLPQTQPESKAHSWGRPPVRDT